MKYSPMINKQKGFTLVELAVVFLIIAVLAAFALPQYQEYVRQGRRAEAMSALMDGAQKLERYYSAHGNYLDGADLAEVFITDIPASGSPYYEIAGVANEEGTTFTLTATAKGSMSDDKCGNLTINQAGAHNIETSSGATVAECWRR